MNTKKADGNVPEKHPGITRRTVPIGGCCAQGRGEGTAKKRSHLVIGKSALLIADYFDRVGFLKISR